MQVGGMPYKQGAGSDSLLIVEVLLSLYCAGCLFPFVLSVVVQNHKMLFKNQI